MSLEVLQHIMRACFWRIFFLKKIERQKTMHVQKVKETHLRAWSFFLTAFSAFIMLWTSPTSPCVARMFGERRPPFGSSRSGRKLNRARAPSRCQSWLAMNLALSRAPENSDTHNLKPADIADQGNPIFFIPTLLLTVIGFFKVHNLFKMVFGARQQLAFNQTHLKCFPKLENVPKGCGPKFLWNSLSLVN